MSFFILMVKIRRNCKCILMPWHNILVEFSLSICSVLFCSLCLFKVTDLARPNGTIPLRLLNALYCIKLSPGGENKSVYSISAKARKVLKIFQILLSSSVNLFLWKINSGTFKIANHEGVWVQVCVYKFESVRTGLCEKGCVGLWILAREHMLGRGCIFAF